MTPLFPLAPASAEGLAWKLQTLDELCPTPLEVLSEGSQLEMCRPRYLYTIRHKHTDIFQLYESVTVGKKRGLLEIAP